MIGTNITKNIFILFSCEFEIQLKRFFIIKFESPSKKKIFQIAKKLRYVSSASTKQEHSLNIVGSTKEHQRRHRQDRVIISKHGTSHQGHWSCLTKNACLWPLDSPRVEPQTSNLATDDSEHFGCFGIMLPKRLPHLCPWVPHQRNRYRLRSYHGDWFDHLHRY